MHTEGSKAVFYDKKNGRLEGACRFVVGKYMKYLNAHLIFSLRIEEYIHD